MFKNAWIGKRPMAIAMHSHKYIIYITINLSRTDHIPGSSNMFFIISIHFLPAINFLISSAIFFNPAGTPEAVSAHVVVCTLSSIVIERLDAT